MAADRLEPPRRARYDDPATAQFLTRDPIYSQTLDAYGYAGNNPLNATDPTGHNKCEAGLNPARWVGNGVDCLSKACVDPGELPGFDENPECETFAEEHPAAAELIIEGTNTVAGGVCVLASAGACLAPALAVGNARAGFDVLDTCFDGIGSDCITEVGAFGASYWVGNWFPARNFVRYPARKVVQIAAQRMEMSTVYWCKGFFGGMVNVLRHAIEDATN